MKITQTKKGFSAVVYIGKDASGKARSKRFTASSKADLKQMILEYQAQRRIYINSTAFGDCLERYISEREGLKSPSTIHGYRSIQRSIKTSCAAFCGLSVDRITDRDVQTVITTLQREDKSPKTMRNWIGLINAVLIAEHQPPAHVVIPARVIEDRPIPSIGEITMLLCLMHGHKLEIPFRLALMGLRRGEICALTLTDLSDDNVLHIHRAAVIGDDGLIEVKNSPKTETSNRFVRLPDHLADQIRKEGRFTPYTLKGLSRAYTEFLKKYQFPPYRFHDCRHFFASYCHSIGVPEADILAGGGWKTSNVMKAVYRHAMAENRASAATANLFARK